MIGTSSPGKTMLGMPCCEIMGELSKENVGTGGLESGGGLKMIGILLTSIAIVEFLLSLSSFGPRDRGLAGMISSIGAAIKTSGAGSGAALIGRGDAARIISLEGTSTDCLLSWLNFISLNSFSKQPDDSALTILAGVIGDSIAGCGSMMLLLPLFASMIDASVLVSILVGANLDPALIFLRRGGPLAIISSAAMRTLSCRLNVGESMVDIFSVGFTGGCGRDRLTVPEIECNEGELDPDVTELL
jgi:hypothetical protein